MAQYAHHKGFVGAGKWFTKQFAEEQEHAAKFIDYLHEHHEKVILQPIASVPTEWNSVLEAFQATLDHEMKVTKLIHGLAELAAAENDLATQNFLAWFIDEQVEEEHHAFIIVKKLQYFEGDKVGLYTIDKELGSR